MINSYIAIDLETTGLDPKMDKIIEIGALKVVDGQVVEEYATLVNPRRKLEPQTIELTGIDNLMLEETPGIEEVIEEIVQFCEGFALLGHHIIFDYSFLKRAAVNGGLTFEKKGMDTLLLCREFMPAEVKKNLAVACRYYQVENQHAHRALSDAYAAHELYQKMLLQHGVQKPSAFEDKFLIYKVKKEQFATKRQKEGLRELIKYHKIDITVQIEHLSRNEISRMTDKIISQYGRIVKR
ncbi:MAG: 3'-5' exonuclease [Hungatella sp.]